jgi:hypothetical protein
MDDSTFLSREIALAEMTGNVMDREIAARLIASRWHSGQAPSLYSFASTGYVSEDTIKEAQQTFISDVRSLEDCKELQALIAFLIAYYNERQGTDVMSLEDYKESQAVIASIIAYFNKRQGSRLID